MLTLILTDLQYEQNVVLNFEKGSNGQNHYSLDSHNTTKKLAQQNFALSQLEGFPYPYMLIAHLHLKKIFWGKLANIIITFVSLFFPSSCFKTP